MLARRSLACGLVPGALVLLGLGSAALGQTGPITFYNNTFEGNLGPGWSSEARIERDGQVAFTSFLGRYSWDQGATLTIGIPQAAITANTNPPGGGEQTGTSTGSGTGTGTGTGTGGGTGTGTGTGGGTYTTFRLLFDLYLIDSWDGADPTHGTDRFFVDINGARRFNQLFGVWPSWTTIGAPTIGPAHLGWNAAWQDQIYRNLAVDFTVPTGTSSLSIRFSGQVMQGLNDESWGVDNVRVSYQVVPTPGSAALLAAGGLLLAAHRRRR